jgi:hypothetical protein
VVKDSYQLLKDLVSVCFSGKKSAEVALAGHEADPETWQAPLAKEGTPPDGRGHRPKVIEAAQQLMALLDEAGRAVDTRHWIWVRVRVLVTMKPPIRCE